MADRDYNPACIITLVPQSNFGGNREMLARG
jgi:hypothetical protein